ncbi:hypothetical protein C0J52_00470 [Blattella germanica]|nr:hypothetical protein C0J52_00470 [Blattella germanica]
MKVSSDDCAELQVSGFKMLGFFIATEVRIGLFNKLRGFDTGATSFLTNISCGGDLYFFIVRFYLRELSNVTHSIIIINLEESASTLRLLVVDKLSQFDLSLLTSIESFSIYISGLCFDLDEVFVGKSKPKPKSQMFVTIHVMSTSLFDKISLSVVRVVAYLSKHVQKKSAQVIPWLLTAHTKPRQYWPHDICVSAPTGSGKTLAFVIPIVQALRHRVVVRVRALIVLPVQDLAVQVHKVFLTYTKHTDLKVALITGQTSFAVEQQQLVNFGAVAGYRSVVDIVITTPGRLVDHLQSTPGFTLKYLRFLVIDEADRVIENVQNDWLYHVYNHINTDTKTDYHVPALTIENLESISDPPPQKLLFSATLTQDPEKLQQLGLFQPKLFTSVVGDTETEYACIVTPESKPLVLHHLVTTNKWKHVLVFVGSRQDAHRLSLLLNHLGNGKLHVAEISSNLTRPAREKILTKFASGELDIIVSSDALARGMDIEGVDYVILYNAPKSVKNYIHRVGRTGRAGRPGTAVTLLLEKTVGHFNEMIHSAGKDPVLDLVVQESDLEEMEDAYKAALEKLKADLEREAEMRVKTVKRSKKMDPLIQKLRDKKRRLKANKQRKQSAIT